MIFFLVWSLIKSRRMDRHRTDIDAYEITVHMHMSDMWAQKHFKASRRAPLSTSYAPSWPGPASKIFRSGKHPVRRHTCRPCVKNVKFADYWPGTGCIWFLDAQLGLKTCTADTSGAKASPVSNDIEAMRKNIKISITYIFVSWQYNFSTQQSRILQLVSYYITITGSVSFPYPMHLCYYCDATMSGKPVRESNPDQLLSRTGFSDIFLK